jgi:hypothetical protein
MNSTKLMTLPQTFGRFGISYTEPADSLIDFIKVPYVFHETIDSSECFYETTDSSVHILKVPYVFYEAIGSPTDVLKVLYISYETTNSSLDLLKGSVYFVRNYRQFCRPC